MTPLEERFWDKVEPTGFCWYWTASSDRGYGRFNVGGKAAYAHRVAYEFLVGPIPEGAVLDHLCRNTLCVNPDHLDVTDHRENALRSPLVTRRGPRPNRRISVCRKGLHPMTDANRMRNGEDQTVCAPCRQTYMRDYDARRRPRKAKTEASNA